MSRLSSRLRPLLRRPGVALLAVVLLLLGLGVAADVTAADEGPVAGTTSSAGPPPTVPLARADGVCPDPAADDTTSTQIGLAAPGPPDTAAAPGVAQLETLRGRPLPGTARPPSSASVAATPGLGPVVGRASGAAAPGLGVDLLTRSTADAARGLLGTACVAPASDFWFVGSGAVVGQRGRVYLSNPEAAPAVADVTLYGPDGPIDAPAGRGIAVDAGRQEVRLLDALSPGTAVFAVHVHARTGRVAAAVRDQQIDGLTPRGADWVPAAAAPARRQVIAGVVAGSGERRLQVVAPGASDAIVKVRLVTDSGSFAPAGLDVIEVPAGSVKDVDLAQYAMGEAVGVELDSDVPVTAGVLVRASGVGPLTDVAWTSAGEPLMPDTPGVVAEARQDSATRTASALLLAAPGADATVRVAALPPATGTPQQVRVPGGGAVVVDLGTVSTAASFALTVTPLAGSGPVYATRAVSESEAKGPLLTLEPVAAGRFTVTVPRVVGDLSTGLR